MKKDKLNCNWRYSSLWLTGNRKTMFAEAASNEVDALFIPIKCSDIKSKWYGESEQKIKEVFTKARKAKKAVIFFDEFEAIVLN